MLINHHQCVGFTGLLSPLAVYVTLKDTPWGLLCLIYFKIVTSLPIIN